MKTLEERFWEKVKIGTENECWEWQSTTGHYGYGIFRLQKKYKYAHRLAWSFTNGKIPNELWVLYKCDNPPCVNPNHLFLGNAKDNAQDRTRKGRNSNQNGELGNNSRLTNEQILEIRKTYKETLTSQEELAAKYGISQSQISNIVLGKEWKHLPGYSEQDFTHRKSMPGTRNSQAKLNSEQVAEIRYLYAQGGITQTELSKMYPVNVSQIGSIVRGKSWQHD